MNYKNNSLNKEDNKALITLNCNLNNKLYSYDIIYDETYSLYKIKPNNSLLIELQKSNEEDLENIIKNIFITKGGNCVNDNNLVINIDLEENQAIATKNIHFSTNYVQNATDIFNIIQLEREEK